MERQRPYWDRAAALKTFTHPIEHDWLAGHAMRSDRILDYGCGYGRVVNEFTSLGYANCVGVDFSSAMVARGKALHPELSLSVVTGLPLPEADGSFDLVILFAVLTCIPEDESQDAVLSECRRLIRTGGLLYISDMPLHDEDDYRQRYETSARRGVPYGVFRTSDGAEVRHHSNERLEFVDGRVRAPGQTRTRRRDDEWTAPAAQFSSSGQRWARTAEGIGPPRPSGGPCVNGLSNRNN